MFIFRRAFGQRYALSVSSSSRHLLKRETTSRAMSVLAEASSSLQPTPSTSKRTKSPSPALAPLDAPVKALFVPSKKKRKQKHSSPEPYSPADVLWHDVRDFLGHDDVEDRQRRGDEWDSPESLVRGEEITIRVGSFTVSGELNSRLVGGTTDDQASHYLSTCQENPTTNGRLSHLSHIPET